MNNYLYENTDEKTIEFFKDLLNKDKIQRNKKEEKERTNKVFSPFPLFYFSIF